MSELTAPVAVTTLSLYTMVTSESGTPNMVKAGVKPELLLGGKYNHKMHFWNLDKRR